MIRRLISYYSLQFLCSLRLTWLWTDRSFTVFFWSVQNINIYNRTRWLFGLFTHFTSFLPQNAKTTKVLLVLTELVKHSARPYSCDSGLGPDWYRFQAAAGTRMPISCTPIARCNTYGTGWLNGGHPTVAEGRVTRQVCFHYWSNCCQSSTIIEVRNCGSFYVYHLNGTDTKNYCQLGYCGTDWIQRTA